MDEVDEDDGDGESRSWCRRRHAVRPTESVRRRESDDGISPSVVVVISTVGDRTRWLSALRVSPSAAATVCVGSARRRHVPRVCKKGCGGSADCAVKGHAGKVFGGP